MSSNPCSSVTSARRPPCSARRLVLPFTSFVDEFGRTWQAVVPEETDEDELASQFVGQLYDVFVEHRGLVLTLLASEALSEEEMA